MRRLTIDDGSVIVFEPMKCFATLTTASTCLANERLRSARHCCVADFVPLWYHTSSANHGDFLDVK